MSNLFVNAPLDRLQGDLLDLFLTHGLQPEIGLECKQLWTIDPDDVRPLARQLQQKNLACTLHAPFHDLVPGGFDARMVALSREKLQRAFSLIKVFKPLLIVCHLGYDPFKHDRNQERWLEVSIDTWNTLIDEAAEQGTQVMFENTYEPDPSIHLRFLHALDHAAAGFCLDTGHLLAFARHRDWQLWLDTLGSWLGHIHLHDNSGQQDEHLAPGAGSFDFSGLFSALNRRQINPLITLEPHRKQDLWPALKFVTTLDGSPITIHKKLSSK